MKPIVLVTCRVDILADRNETRDAVDQRLIDLISTAGFTPVVVPNNPQVASDIFASMQPVGLVLSGGNDIGQRPERDATEKTLVELCEKSNLPVVGICRGFQFLVHLTGGQLEKISGHVGTRHEVMGRSVNSYHNFGFKTLPTPWEVLGTAPDGTIEIAKAGKKLGIMWHPEREAEFHADDIRMIREHLTHAPKALILAAGRGRRMKGLTDERPKALLPVGGKPLLQHALTSLYEAGMNEVGVITGYRAELLNLDVFKATFNNPKWETTNMVCSLNSATPWLEKFDCVVCYSDILFTAKTVAKLAAAKGDIVITNNMNWQKVWSQRFTDPLVDAETFKKDSSGKLIEIGKKPQSLADIQGQYMGLLKFTPRGWAQVQEFIAELPPERFAKIDMTSTLNALIERGVNIDVVDVHEEWYEFDSEEDVNAYQEL